MANIKVTDQELKAILSELESELASALGSASLAKSEDSEGGEKKPEKSKSDDSGSEKSDSPPPKEGGEGGGEGGGDAPPPPAEGGGDAPPAEGGGDAPPAAPPAPPAPPTGDAPAAPAAPATPAAAAPTDPAAAAPAAPADPAALKMEYAQLPPEVLKAHYLAAKAALFEATQMAAQPPAPAPAPMGPPGGAPPPAAPAPMGPPPGGQPPMPPPPGVMKGEKMPSEQNGKLPGTPTSPDIAKSEKNELAELKLQLEVMTKALSKMAGVPMQKAVTDLTYVAKSEEKVEGIQLSPEQIKVKLNEVARNPLTKNEDRVLMNKYVCGSVKVDAIQHLLK